MKDNRILKEIKQFNNGNLQFKTDIVISEQSFTITINGDHLVTLSVLPEHLENLALGFLFSEGIVTDRNEIIHSDYCQEENRIDFSLDIENERLRNFKNSGEKTSGCGSSLSSTINDEGSGFQNMVIDPKVICSRMRDFIKSSSLFKETGGVHIAGLLIDESLTFIREDIGRHNAVDKAAGVAISKNLDLSKTILLCSGRISSEIVRKAIRLRIPMIVSKSAPTSKAISLGWQYGIYLIGFARGDRFNLYTGTENLKIP